MEMKLLEEEKIKNLLKDMYEYYEKNGKVFIDSKSVTECYKEIKRTDIIALKQKEIIELNNEGVGNHSILMCMGIRLTEKHYTDMREGNNSHVPESNSTINNVTNNIQTNNGNITGIHNGNQNITQIHNDLDKIISLFQESDLENKKMLISILKEIKEKPGEREPLSKFVGELSNVTTIATSLMIPIMNLILGPQ